MAEKTYSQMRREFYEAYRTKIVPAVRKFEEERQKKESLAIKYGLMLSFSGLIMLSSTIIFDSSSFDALGRLGGSFIVIGMYIWHRIKKNFENKVKEQIMSYVTACFENLQWSNGKYSTGNLFRKSNLIACYDREQYDDIFKGSHNNVNFDIVESCYTLNDSSIFNGVIIKFDMNKNFSGNTVVKGKQPDGTINGVQDKNLKQTSLEDIEFNKKYTVFTDDEVEARYLLTPSFMEKLKNVQVAFSADKVDCAFYDKYLLVALHTNKDLFSLCSLLNPVDDEIQFFTMYEEIVSIIKLIDYFKLNQKTGL